jgi:hypothetical protein
METLYNLWGKRNPQWETRNFDSIINIFTDYGKGVTEYTSLRGKILGAGYEIYIFAFFIGLYFDKTKPLVADVKKRKTFGWEISKWGNIESKLGRRPYGEIRYYIFAALIARTDIDLIALDKGDISPKEVVDRLIKKMEEYANFGFDYIREKLEDNPNYFFGETAFLRVFLSFLNKDYNYKESDISQDDEPESLD